MTVVDLVFKQEVQPSQAADRIGAMLVGEPGFRQAGEQQIGEEMFTMRWLRDGDAPVAVDLTFDRSVPMLMVSIVGNEQLQVDKLASSIRASLADVLDTSDVLVDTAAATPDNAALLVRAAVGCADRFDGRLFGLVEDALRSDDVNLRQCGAKSAALLKYAQFAATLRHAMDSEKDEATARMLALALSKVRNANLV
jgi:hypothetical protein